MEKASQGIPIGRIRAFALVCVAITSLFIMGMRIWDQISLAQTDWCSRALGAAKYAAGRPSQAIDQCFQLQKMQISTIGNVGYIDAVTPALCLLVLVVIVIAGGRLSVDAGKTGIKTTIGPAEEEPPEVVAARRTAAAATEESQHIAEEAGETPAPAPTPAPAKPAAPAAPAGTEILE